MIASTAVWLIRECMPAGMVNTASEKPFVGTIWVLESTAPISCKSTGPIVSMRSIAICRVSRPNRISSAASSCMRGVPQRKLPVSVTRPAYKP